MPRLILAIAIAAMVTGCPAPEPRATLAGTCASASLAVRSDGVILAGDGCGRVELVPTAVGEGDLTVSLVLRDGTIVPTVSSATGASLRAVVFTGELSLDGDGALRVWRQGYQSWSWSGVVDLVAPTLDIDGIPIGGGDGDAMTVIDEDPSTSWWVGLVGRPRAMSLLIGADGATDLKFRTAFSADHAWAVYGGRGEAIAIPAGGSLELDPMVLAIGADPGALYAAYGATVAAAHPHPLPAAPPTGWATWYTYYSRVTETDVRDNLDPAAALGLDVFQIDDGWQVRWGQWDAGDDFPSGMSTIAAEISDRGMTPGLWMAPFYVHRDSPVYAAHPDWWVRDLAGHEMTFTNVGSGDYAVIDVTNPDAADWLRGEIERKVTEGYGYFKFDFLYAGAQEGLRHDDVTGLEAYHLGLTLLREAAGDSYVLVCGAPLLPSVGYADGYRTGSDIAFEVSPDADPAFLRWAARQTAARSWTNGAWWWSDADQILTRGSDDPSGQVAANAASGGTWQLGDALPAIDPAVVLVPGAMATIGAGSRPIDPLLYPSGLDAGPLAEKIHPDDRVPVEWLLDSGHVVLVNLGDGPVTANAPPGAEVLTGETSQGPSVRTLAPGHGEIWAIGAR